MWLVDWLKKSASPWSALFYALKKARQANTGFTVQWKVKLCTDVKPNRLEGLKMIV